MTMIFNDFYKNTVKQQLMKDLGLNNIFAVPKIVKIVINVGAGEAVTDKKILNKISEDLTSITGQKPVITLAKKSISAFKIRKGLPIGVKVTLRGKRMIDFLERLIKIVLPRIRDFKGIFLKNFDKQGNLNLGISEQTLFPEIDYDKIDKIRGLEITIVTNAKNDKTAKIMLKALGMPFAEEKNYGKKI